MRSTALKRSEAYAEYNVKTVRLRIVKEAEVACHMPGNKNGPGLGAYEEKYLGMGESDFA